MKIHRIKFYQAVSIWNGSKYQLVTHLNLDNPEISGKLDISLIEGTGVMIKTDGAATLITLNNVAYLNAFLDEEKPKAASKK